MSKIGYLYRDMSFEYLVLVEYVEILPNKQRLSYYVSENGIMSHVPFDSEYLDKFFTREIYTIEV